MFTKKEIDTTKRDLDELYNNPVRAIHLHLKELPEKSDHKSEPTIRKFFNGEKVKPHTAKIIYTAAVELLEEEKDSVNALKRRGKRLNGTTTSNSTD